MTTFFFIARIIDSSYALSGYWIEVIHADCSHLWLVRQNNSDTWEHLDFMYRMSNDNLFNHLHTWDAKTREFPRAVTFSWCVMAR